MCTAPFVVTVVACRFPCFEHRRKGMMQPALHTQITESKEVGIRGKLHFQQNDEFQRLARCAEG
jgi:hypothetical protein